MSHLPDTHLESGPSNGGTLHDQAVCSRLLESANASVPLQILPSKILGAGLGLFVSRRVDAGKDILQSEPMINAVDKGKRELVCDYCYSNSASPIHPTGRFNTVGDANADMKACAGCKVCYYCSRNCQRKAWKRYHKSECAIFAKLPNLEPRTQALYRLLNMEKNGTVTQDQWASLNGLRAHVEEYLASELAELVVGGSMHAASQAESLLEDEHILHLYCVLLTNCLCINPAEGGTLGTSFDPVVSLMNHSCEPNAFVFFEGNSLRVRSLRPLNAGDEITQCYADVDMDVILRRETLRKDYFFDCLCDRCEKQLRMRDENFPGKQDLLQHAQQELVDRVNEATLHFDTADINAIEKDLQKITRSVLSHGAWPDNLEPLPSVRLQIAKLFKAQKKFSSALNYALKGCLYFERRIGPTWVRHLFALLQILASATMSADPSVTRDSAYPTEEQLWNVLHGYLDTALKASLETFGEDVAYTKAIQNWHNKCFQASNAHQPGSRAFRNRFDEAQLKLLIWAGVDAKRIVTLP